MLTTLGRGRLVLAAGLIASAALACSTGSSAERDGPSSFEVETSQLFVTIRNQAGLALTDIRVAIVPLGRSTLYSTTIGRMDSGEKRDLALSAFTGRDGTPFTLRVARPKAVRVSGTDLNGQTHETEVEWR